MKRVLSLSLLLFSSLVLFAQQAKEPINPKKIYEDYKKLYEEEKYDEALIELNKIDRNDTSYADAMLEKVLVCLRKEKFDEAVKTCRAGIALNSPHTYKFYINMGVAYNRDKKYDEALTALNEGLTKFPKNYLLHFNKGIVYVSQKKIPEAIEMFKKTIQLNPYYASSHLELGLIAADEGKISQAMLAMNMFLTLEPGTNRAYRVIGRLNEIVSSKYEREPKGAVLSPEGGDDFSELDLIITNYAALSKSFKVPVKSELPLIKQNYALFSKLQYDKDDKGFWMQTYVPFFAELYKQNQFTGFSYYILQASENPDHKALVKKNMPIIDKFIAWAVPQIDKIQSLQLETVEGKKQLLQHWFASSGHYLYRIGTSDPVTGKLKGYSQYYNASGALLSHGNYDSEGERDGSWTFYYENGAKEEEAVYKHGKLDQKLKYYNEQNTLIMEAFYNEGKLSNEKKVYNSSGRLIKRYNYKDGKMDGAEIEYYNLGEQYKETVAKYANGAVKDTIYNYHDNGALKAIKLISNNEFNGDYKTYYRSGKPDIDAKYLNGQYNGKYKEYFYNGQLYMEGTYTNGKEIGKWKTYTLDGKLTEESQYDEKGKRNGVFRSFDTDGKMICEMDYASGEVVGYRYYDKQGKIIKEGKKQKGEFEFVGFYPEGKKKFEGVYTSEGKKGLWKYYDSFGNLSSEENFNKNGLLDGSVKAYYPSGQLKSVSNYKDNTLNGMYATYHSNGKLKTEGWYVDGKTEGYVYSYYIDGTLEQKEYYLQDELTGYKESYYVTGKLEKEELYKDNKLVKITYYDSTGVVTTTVNLENGTGDYTLKYPNGKVKFAGKYIEGAAHGIFYWYYSNGNITTEGNYHNDQKNGPWKWYYENKTLEIEGSYVYGKAEGKWKYYFPNGKLKRTENYENGIKIGEWIWYYENGQVELKKNYVNDEQEGEASYYGIAGELQMKRYYKDGIAISYTYHDASGKPVPLIDISSGTYTFVSYYQNGKKSREYKATKGVFEGMYTEYFADGKVMEESPYKDDELFGVNKFYYADGKLKSEETYTVDGNNEGISRFYYPDGKVEKELNYKLDQLHGICNYYDSKGKLVKKQYYYSGDLLKEELF